MIGLSILLVITVYVLIAGFVVKKFPGKKAKYIAIAVFVLIPLGDYLLGLAYFYSLCGVEGGIKINKSVIDVDGFLENSDYLVFSKRDLVGFEYKFIEKPIQGKILHFSFDNNKNLIKEEILSPLSKYSLNGSSQSLLLGVEKKQWLIEDINSKETLATANNFFFYGGWIKKILGQIGGGPARCPNPHIYPDDFIKKVLKPTTN